MNRILAALRRWLNPRATETALDDEIHSYLQHDIDARIRSGMSPDQARRAAQIAFGGMEQVKEQTRESRSGAHVESAIQDFRYALRTLIHAPGFSLSVMASLALGIAAVVSAFAFLNGWLLRPHPGVGEQSRLVQLTVQEPCTRGDCWLQTTSSSGDYAFLRSTLDTLDGLAAYTTVDIAARIPMPRSLQATLVSENYFEVLKMRPRIGRFFSAGEGTLENANVAVLSHELWQREFAADPSVMGQTIFVANQSVRIIGVAAPDFAGLDAPIGRPGSTLWLPLPLADAVSSPHMAGKAILPSGERQLRYVGRLSDNSDIARVQAQATGLTTLSGKPRRVEISEQTRGVRSAPLVFGLIMPIPILVLFLACLNAANLLLVRASRRHREIAIRLAIGASRWRVVRQLLLESLVLAAGSTLMALPLAWLGLQAASGYLLIATPIDLRVLLIAVATAAISTVAFGLAPAFLMTRTAPARALTSAQSSGDGTPQRTRGRRALVVAQVALSLGLLAAGTQLVSAFRAIDRSVGTPSDRLLVASIDLEQLKYTPEEAKAFYARVLSVVSKMPEVERAGLAHSTALWTFRQGKGPDSISAWRAQDSPQQSVMYIGGYVAGDFFDALGLRLLNGRNFTPEDAGGERPRVAIVNRPLADQLFNGNAVGRELWVMSRYGDESSAVLVNIAGVVEPALEPSYSRDGKQAGAIYVPVPLRDELALAIYVRSRESAEVLKGPLSAAVRQIDPRVPFVSLASLDEINERERLPHTGMSRAAAFLGTIALVLATLGLYAVVSFIMNAQLREIAIRLTLGAQRSTVFRMIFRQALRMVLTGSAIGVVVAYAASQILRWQVHGTLSVDKLSFLGAVGALLIPLLLASVIPALRAMRTDPAKFLRAD